MEQKLIEQALGTVASDPRLWSDYVTLCSFGGRQAGSQSETRAIDWARKQLEDIAPGLLAVTEVPYAAWRCMGANVTVEGATGNVECTALLGAANAPRGGLCAEVVNLGRGTQEVFEHHAGDLRGRIVLVRHEYPFAAGHIHRRRKYNWALEHGAAGFLIANPSPGSGPVSGSSGRAGAAGIPALGIDAESAARLAAHRGRRREARLQLESEDFRAMSTVLALDLPGRDSEWIVLSAHIDGHALAQSALDNASGVAAALALARAFAPHLGGSRYGLRVCLFSAEEWALAGSREWLDRMAPDTRATMKLNVNLDTIAGDGHLSALTSGFPALDRFVADATARVGLEVGTYRPLMSNSDHYNFARHGIPALRLVAGFDRPQCNVRHILTRADTLDKAAPGEIKSAALAAGAILAHALAAAPEDLAGLSRLQEGVHSS